MCLAELQGESQKKHVDKPEACWKGRDIMDRREVELLELFGFNEFYVWLQPNTTFKNLNPAVEDNGGSMMIWACFAAPEPGWFAIIDKTINSELKKTIFLEEKKKTKAQQKVDHATRQQPKSFKEWLRRNAMMNCAHHTRTLNSCDLQETNILNVHTQNPTGTWFILIFFEKR